MFKNCACKIPDHSQDQGSEAIHSKCKPCSIGKMLLMIGGLVLLVAALAQLAWSAPASSTGMATQASTNFSAFATTCRVCC